MKQKTNREIENINFEIRRRKNLIYHISLKDTKTDQDEKDLKMLKKSINSFNQNKKGLHNEH